MACTSIALADAPKLTIELNKLEQVENACRFYVVINNESPQNFETLKLDVVLFRLDGVIARRLALDLAPLKANKRTVKLFDIDKEKCETIGSVLVNEINDCRTDKGPVDDCLSGLNLKSLSQVTLSK